ncbi:hypothetical protein P3T18_004955 [Paraburkholderia sp. GAS199]
MVASKRIVAGSAGGSRNLREQFDARVLLTQASTFVVRLDYV